MVADKMVKSRVFRRRLKTREKWECQEKLWPKMQVTAAQVQAVKLESDSEASDTVYLPHSAVSRSGRRRQMPSRRSSSGDKSDNNGVLCCLCYKNEPDDLAAPVLFWVDCSKCGCWVHNHCAFGNNTASHKYMCQNCSQIPLFLLL